MCLTGEARLAGHAEHVRVVHERDCGEMGHISYRSLPKWKPTKVRDGQQESQSQYLWILNMWHASLPTNLSNKSPSRLYGLSEITREGPNLARMFQILRSALRLVAVHNLANWHAIYLFVFLISCEYRAGGSFDQGVRVRP